MGFRLAFFTIFLLGLSLDRQLFDARIPFPVLSFSVAESPPTHTTTSPPETVKVVKPTETVETTGIVGRPVGEQPPVANRARPPDHTGFERLMEMNQKRGLASTEPE